MADVPAWHDRQAPSPAPDPLCFVLIPPGRKLSETGASIDFDAVYDQVIAPAVRAAGLEPIRADRDMTESPARKPMFERLVLCDYAVADLTLANATVFYELGLRDARRPHTTVLLFASGMPLPLGLQPGRALSYSLSTTGAPADGQAIGKRLTERLVAARDTSNDIAVFKLAEGFDEIERLKTDVFRDQARYSEPWKERLARGRAEGIDAIRRAEHELGDLRDVEAGIIIDLFLSYRAVKGYPEMVSLAERMPRPLAKTPMVREQLGFALNRLGRPDEAEHVLVDLIRERGPSSETYGLLGRVYADQWYEAVRTAGPGLAAPLLDKAIDAYLRGFEADSRDAFPGINAVTLMEVRDPPDSRREHLIPVVSYAVERRLASGEADYWDHASQMELAVLAKDEAGALSALAGALAAVREPWEPESTGGNLELIRKARERRGDSVPWAEALEKELFRKAGLPDGP
jgi:hypothetical protein